MPYGIGVVVERFFEREDGIVEISADLICEKKPHKSIVIGKGGEMIKKISTLARLDMEKLLDSKVYLELFVKVKEEWRDSERLLREIGYDKKEL